MRGYLAMVLLAALAFGCTKTEVVDAPTQVMLRISSRDPQLLEEFESLRLSISLREGDGWKEPALRSFPREKLQWPIDIPITPRVRADAYKQFEIVVEARKADAVLAQARVISGFLPDERRLLELELFGCPGRPGYVCAEEACVGDECEECKLDGKCGPVESVDPNDLSPWKGEIGTQPSLSPIVPDTETDAGVGASGPMDAAQVDRDTGLGMDTSTQDEALFADAMLPMTDAADAGADAIVPETREFALGEPGIACPPYLEGTLACAGHASSTVLRCELGTWQNSKTCSASERCDSRIATEQAVCRAVPAACSGKAAGDTCDGVARFECGIDLVTVAPKPCSEHTHCSSVSSVQCVCDEGYVDDGQGKCINPDNCPTGACGGGECVDGLGDYSCKCGAGFTGTGTKTCTAVMYCPKDACVPGGTCVDQTNWSCNCGAGFSGSGTQACANINDCPTDRCKAPGGTCKDGVASYSCTCSPGFSGPDCQNDICAPNPCRNGGTCSRIGTLCTCPAGFSGPNCEVDRCAPNPCKNGGTCSRTGTLCTCPPGFSGANCEIDICSPNPCANGGTCNRSGALCSCPAGFSGTRCETDACNPNPCQHSGVCSRTAQGAACDCGPSGYMGSRCEVDINECASQPCGADNTCVNLANDYSCTCSDRYFQAGAKSCVPRFVDVAAGRFATCARRVDSSVACWGFGGQGQTGDPNRDSPRIPTVVQGLKNATTLSGTFAYFCARRSNAVPVCWGSNVRGQMGVGTFAPVVAPFVAVDALANATQLSAGLQHTCARMTDGTARCSGYNEFGQLGDGTTAGSGTFVPVVGLTGSVVEMAAGTYHSCARLADATVMCWGANTLGELGDGTVVDSLAPVRVRGLSGVAQLVVREGYGCARTTDAVSCWGAMSQIGPGSGPGPWTIAGLVDVLQIALGGVTGCARTRAGDVLCWGASYLGNGTTNSSYEAAVPVSLPRPAVAIAVGIDHACAVLDDGNMYCWGGNDNGQLGDGSTQRSLVPVAVRPF